MMMMMIILWVSFSQDQFFLKEVQGKGTFNLKYRETLTLPNLR